MAEDGTLQNSDGDLLKEVHDLTQQIQALQDRNKDASMAPEDREQMQRLTQAIGEVNSQLASRVAPRQSEFDINPREQSRGTPAGMTTKQWLDRVHIENAKGPDKEAIDEFQKVADDAYLVSAILRRPVQSLDLYKDLLNTEIVRKTGEGVAQSTVGTAGDGWYPVAFSAQVHDQVRLQRRVAALHPRINMPTDPYKLPIEGPDANTFVVSEALLANDYVTGSALVPSSTGITASLTNLALATKKVGARIVVSAEADEASVVAMLPYFRGKLVRGMGDSEEDATLNGDTAVGTGSAMDADMTPSANLTNPRVAWSGYRKLAPAATKIAIAGGGTTIDVSDIRNLKTKFGKYGVNPRDLTWVTGPIGYNRLLSLKDGSNPSPVTTLEKYGTQATILTGEIARIDGIPIILSEHIREDLSTTGVWDGVTTDRTVLHLVNRAAFVYGDFRRMTLNSRYVPDTDQNVMVVLQRLTFASWFSGAATVGHLYAIQ